MKLLRVIDFKELCRRKGNDLGMSQKEVQVRSGMAHSTYYRKMKHPEEITISELHVLDQILHFTEGEITHLVKGYLR